MIRLPLLLADIPVKLIIWGVMGLIWIIGALASWQKKGAANAERRRQENANAEPDDAPEQAPATVMTGNPALDREIETFLRRAQQVEASSPPTATAAPAPATPPQRRKRGNKQPKPRPAPAPLGQEVAQQVARDLDNRKFTERAAHLSQVDRGSAKTPAQAQQKYTPPSAAAPTGVASSAAAAPPATLAAGFAALLADTGNVRQAIILSEILRRPEERW